MRIGFIGLGAMGQPMARRLVEAGQDVVVADIDPAKTAILQQRGATVAENAKAVADEADIVLTCVASLPAGEAVIAGPEGAIAGKRAGSVVNFSTTGSAFSKAMAEKLSQEGKAFMDAPISGGPAGADEGTLAIMCSGDRATYDRLAPTLDAVSSKLVWLGEAPGAAQVMKLVNNIAFFGTFAITLEAMTLGKQAGLDPALMIDVLNAGTAASRSTERIIPNHVVSGSYDFGGSNAIIAKDIELWRKEAENHEAPMWLGSAVRTLCLQTVWRHGYEGDFTLLAETLEAMARGGKG